MVESSKTLKGLGNLTTGYIVNVVQQVSKTDPGIRSDLRLTHILRFPYLGQRS